MSCNIQEVANTAPTFVLLDDFNQKFSHITLNDIRGQTELISTLNNAEGGMLDSSAVMLDKANEQPQCNVVLCVKRPHSVWRRLFSSTDGHACSVVKVDQTLFIADVQKRHYRAFSLMDD